MIQFPIWSQELFRPHRYKIPYGGRGSTKSWTVARALITLAHTPTILFPDDPEGIRILCARELQNSIQESVHQLLSDQIDDMGLNAYFDIQKQSIKHKINLESQFIFSGIRMNVTKIKSMERIKICWIEEAEKTSKESLKTIKPTLREAGSELWMTFNPDQEDDPVYHQYVKEENRPPNAWVQLVNWRDNPWFPEELKLEMAYDFKVDVETAQHVWEGACNSRSEAVIFRNKYEVEDFVPVTNSEFDEFNWSGPYYGGDWGFSNDPCTLMKLWIFERILYIEYESWHIGLELDDIAGQWAKDIPSVATDGRVIRCDSQRPDTISKVRSNSGWDVVAAEKGPGSVEDGIQFLRSFEKIVIHTRCKHQIIEARTYKYKVDKITGDVTTAIVDANNHCWDADRYALEPAIKSKKSIYDCL